MAEHHRKTPKQCDHADGEHPGTVMNKRGHRFDAGLPGHEQGQGNEDSEEPDQPAEKNCERRHSCLQLIEIRCGRQSYGFGWARCLNFTVDRLSEYLIYTLCFNTLSFEIRMALMDFPLLRP